MARKRKGQATDPNHVTDFRHEQARRKNNPPGVHRAYRAHIEPEAFEQMRGAVSFPFQPGKHQRIAVKVLDFRGNEVVRVLPLGGVSYK